MAELGACTVVAVIDLCDFAVGKIVPSDRILFSHLRPPIYYVFQARIHADCTPPLDCVSRNAATVCVAALVLIGSLTRPSDSEEANYRLEREV